jgi:Mrp family chromosome partitioning ATPase
MQTIVERLAAAADIVIFDSSPINLFTDPAVLSTLVEGSIVVVDADRTQRAAVRAARDALSIVGTRVLGLVMNRMPSPRGEGSGSYGYSTATLTSGSQPAAAGQGGRAMTASPIPPTVD